VLLEQRVVDVMAGIAFVAGEVDRAIDVDRQVGVDLDQAAEVALVPVVAAPRLVGDVLDGEGTSRTYCSAASFITPQSYYCASFVT
jgi:hypothetical protein